MIILSSYKKYASEEYVEERIANHNHGESTGGVSQDYVDEQIANHTHEEYATIEYVDEQIAASGGGGGESTGGVSQEYVDEQIANHTHEEYATVEHMQSIDKGGTGQTSIEDTTYTTARYRASSIHSSTTTPSTNGVIAWTYE